MCNTLIVIVIIMILLFANRSQESFQFQTSTGSSMVLTDSDGNLSSIPFPKGIVVIWTGALADVPKGWALCDGTQGTPDLRGRFVLGVNPSDNKNDLTARPMKTTGGEETVTLTIDQMPSHDHKISNNNACFKNGGCDERQTMQPGASGKMISDKTGGDKPHNNMPPYFSLAYIMKL